MSHTPSGIASTQNMNTTLWYVQMTKDRRVNKRIFMLSNENEMQKCSGDILYLSFWKGTLDARRHSV